MCCCLMTTTNGHRHPSAVLLPFCCPSSHHRYLYCASFQMSIPTVSSSFVEVERESSNDSAAAGAAGDSPLRDNVQRIPSGISLALPDGAAGSMDGTLLFPSKATKRGSFQITRVVTKNLEDGENSPVDSDVRAANVVSNTLLQAGLAVMENQEACSFAVRQQSPDEQRSSASSPGGDGSRSPQTAGDYPLSMRPLLPSRDVQSRFRLVKIAAKEPFKRGRWTCQDSVDPLGAGSGRLEDSGIHMLGHSVSSVSLATSFAGDSWSDERVPAILAGNYTDLLDPARACRDGEGHLITSQSCATDLSRLCLNVNLALPGLSSDSTAQQNSENISSSTIATPTEFARPIFEISDCIEVEAETPKSVLLDSNASYAPAIMTADRGSSSGVRIGAMRLESVAAGITSVTGLSSAALLEMSKMIPAAMGQAQGAVEGESGASTVAIDNKIEQAMDLVKSHLMFAVREEVELLKEQIKDLVERNQLLEYENRLLRASAPPEVLARLQSLPPLPTTYHRHRDDAPTTPLGTDFFQQ